MNSAISSVLWGLYLACSWTWCIGLYLPVLMIERWGWPGFIAFAVPNVIGCAAFGYVVKTRAQSEAMVERHGAAMAWFSVITVAYHVYFIIWLMTPARGPGGWLPIIVAALAIGIGLASSVLEDRGWLRLGLIVYGVSLTLMALVGAEPLQSIGWTGELEFIGLVGVIPLLCFGFLLCPYLDLTFHRAIQRSTSRHAFAVFGLTFLVMILLTCMIYALDGRLENLVLGHILAQCVFTMGAHMREIRRASAISSRSLRWMALLAPLLAAGLPDCSRLFTRSLDRGEIIYLAFLVVCYGLLFPGYVLSSMKVLQGGLWRDHKEIPRRLAGG